MPPAGPIWNIDYLNANSQRKYPLSEEAGLRDTSDSFSLPNDFLVDFLWPIHADATIDPSLFHLAAVGIFGTGVTISIGYDGAVIGNVSIDATTFQRNTTYFVQGAGDFFDTVGKVVVGSLETLLENAGSFQFDVVNGRFEPTVIRPDVRGVSAFYIRNGTDLSEAIQGDIVLQAGTNFLINRVPGPGAEPDRIILSAIDGAGLNQDCDCNENATLPCIQTINGIAPDENGDFALLGDDCLELQAIANGIQLADNCSRPCCGCDELQVVLDAVQTFANQVFALEQLASQIEGRMEMIQTNLLSSKSGTTQ